jgi:RNA polymerase sigma-70 factor, ECF subfamily
MNLLRNRKRAVGERSDRRVSLESLEEGTPGHSGHEPSLEDRIAHKVRELIQSLSSVRDRRVLVRFYLEEDDKETICRDLGVSPLQFDKILHRARRRLRESLESQGLRGSDFLTFLLCVV